jgi:hypothetical protein
MKAMVARLGPFLTLALATAIVVVVFSMILYKASPPGTDAFTYIHEAMWVQDNDAVPQPYQKTYANANAYVSPITALNLFLLSDTSGQDITSSVNNFYQIILIALLALSLVALALTSGSPRLALLTLVGLLGSYGLYRLNIGSTLANLLAFTLVNSIAITLWWLRKKVQLWHLALLLGQLLGLIYLHRYLTAPIVLAVLALYGCVVLLVSRDRRSQLVSWIQHHRRLAKLSAVIAVSGLVLVYIVFQNPIFEAIRSFITTDSGDTSDYIFLLSDYRTYIGQPLYVLGVLGFIAFPFAFRHYWPQFGFVWCLTAFVLGLPLFALLGIDFYYDRTVIMAIPYLALFGAIMIEQVIVKLSPLLQRLTTAAIIVTGLVIGVSTNVDIYYNSNFVTPEHEAAYAYLTAISQPDEIALTNPNTISATRHDAIISHRDIRALTVDPQKVDQLAVGLEAARYSVIQQPDNRVTQKYLRSHNIHFVILVKTGTAEEPFVRELIKSYRTSPHFVRAFANATVEIYQLVDPVNARSMPAVVAS